MSGAKHIYTFVVVRVWVSQCHHYCASQITMPCQLRELISCELRLNCRGPFLAFLFDVSASNASRTFLKWLAQMDIRLQDLIIWPRARKLAKNDA